MSFLYNRTGKLLLSAFLVIALNTSSKAQTTLVVGDIAFSGFIANAAVPDQFSFVLLKAVTSTTVIKFTDFGWRNGTLSFNSAPSTESELTLTIGSNLAAGTEIIIDGTTATIAGAGSAGTLVHTIGAGVFNPTLSFTTSGDQIFAYQGTFAAPVFIAGIHMNVEVGTTAAAWDPAAAGILGSTSEKPAALTTGTNALWFVTENDNARYDCALGNITTAPLALASLNNPANWIANSTNPPGFTLPTGCNYLGILSSPPAFTLHPVNTTVCEGANTSFTITATGAVSYQWQVDNGGGFANIINNATYSGATTTTLNITAATNGLNGFIYRCVATNGSGPTNSNPATLTVTALPVNPTLLAKTPAAVSVADGTPVSATFNAGSGGSGCTDDYRYTTDGGGSYTAYTPGNNISTTGLAAGTGYVFIEGRRAGCATCSGSYVVLAAWYVTPLPAGATTLNAGDIAFSGHTSTVTDDFSFVLLKNIGPGTVINFTDNGWLSTNVFGVGEQTVTWTSNAAYPAGTEIIISGLTATLAAGGSAGTVTGTALSLITGGDQVLAYRGLPASPTFISAIHMNVEAGSTAAAWDGAVVSSSASALPTGLTTGVNCIWIGTAGDLASEFDNARYGTCAGPGTLGPINTLRAALNNQANWIRDNLTPPGFLIPTGCLYFGLGSVPTITLHPVPSSVCAGTNTSFTITAGGAITYQWQVDPGTGFVNLSNDATYSDVTTTTLNITATPFSLNGFLYRCVATNGSGSTNSNSALLTVTAVPVRPTLLAKTPAANVVADGTPVSATFNAGSGGTGCSDDFRYTIDGGTVYLPYTPGTPISTIGLAAASGFVFIEGRRANCSAGCQGTYEVLAAWRVSPLPAAPTTLNAGDIAFSGYAATAIPDEFSFVLLRNIGPGTVINFTDNGWLSTNVFGVGEQTVTWTAPAGGLPGGTEIKIAGLTATRSGGGAAGIVTGAALSLISTGDQVLAYRGTAAAPTFISAIHMNVEPGSTVAAWDGAVVSNNASALPTGLTSGVNCIWIGTPGDLASEFNNSRYGNCAGPGVLGPLTGLRAALNNQANWISDDNTPPSFSLPTGCNYLLAICETISITSAPGTDAQTLCINTAITNITYSTTGATGATFSGLPAGVTGNWAANVVTISGTPTASGTFNYTVTLTGGTCGGITATGSIVVNPVNTISLSSAVGTDNQTVLVNTPITNITYATTGATGATVSPLPAGVTGVWAANVVTISGTPTVTGTFNYTVTLTGGCGAITATGTITVVACSITLTSAAGTNAQTVCNNSPITNITYATTGATGATFSGLPTSVTGNWATNVATISGTPTVAGVFNYTVTLTGGGCGAFSASGTITVNGVTGGTVAADQTICSGGDPAAFTETAASTGSGTLTYQWQSSTTSCAAGFSNIAGSTATTYDAPAGLLVTTYYRRVTTSTLNAVACTANSNCVTVTVNDVTGGTVAADQTICSGGDPAAFTETAASTGSGTLTYQWQSSTTSCAAGFSNIAGATATTYDAPAGLLVTTYYRRVTTSTLNAVACTANSNCVTVTVNDVTGGTVAADQTICSGGDPAAFTQTVASTGSGTLTYQWQSSTTSCAAGFSNIAGATGTTYDAPAGLLITTYYRRVTTSTLNAVACTAISNCVTVTVNPTPDAVATPASQTICSANPITTIVLTGSVPGTTFNWTRDNTVAVTGIAASGSGNISGSLTNTTNAPVTVTFTITPTANGCPGTPITATVVVNPIPNAVAIPAAQTVCSGSAITTIVLTGNVAGTVYNWIRDNTVSVTGIAASGAGDISGSLTNTTNAPVTVTFTITPSYTNAGVTCTGTSVTSTVVVNPIPNAVATPAAQTICSGSNITPIILSGNVTNTIFDWTRDNTGTVTGIGASGTGDIGGSLVNTTNAPVTVTFTITPSYTNAGVTCTGTPITATVVVNPIPNAVATPATQTICSGSAITTIVLTGNVAGTVYNWTRNNTGTVTGIAASGTGNISGSLTNTTTSPITVTFSITPSFTNAGVTCTGATITATVVVNPIPDAIANPASQTICSGSTITTISISGNVIGTVFNWTRDNTVAVTGIAASGSGNISGALTNTTNAPVTVTFTITPSFTNAGVTCTGTPITATVLVNPTPNAVATPASQTICSANAITTIVLSGAVSGTTFNWTRDNTATVTGIAASGSGNISGALTNTTNAPVTVTFTITPTANGCPGAPITATVLVNPTPNAVAAPAAQTICSANSITTIVLSGNVSGTIFNWTRDNTATVTGIAASGSGNISGSLTNTTNAPVTVTFTITPTANGCPGPPVTATVLVNPTPNAVATPASQTICSGTAITTIALTGAVSGTTFNWTRDNTVAATGIVASGSGNISGTLTNTTTAAVTVTFTITPTANGCPGAPITATVVVNAVLTITCPANIVVNAAAGTCSAVVNYPAATVTGTPAPTVTYSSASGSTFPVGVTTVTVTASNICGTVSCTFTITVNDVQVPLISTQPVNRAVCIGSNATFSVVATNVASYQWQQLNGTVWVNIPGATASSFTVNNTTLSMNNNNYRVALTGPCGTVVYSNQVILVVNPLPLIYVTSLNWPELLPNTTTTLTATGNPSGGSFAWLFNGNPMTGITGPSVGPLTVENVGTYSVIYTDPNGCVSTSLPYRITAGVTDYLWVYPNPNTGQFNVRFYNRTGESATLKVFNYLGQLVHTQSLVLGIAYSNITVNMSNQAAGVYTVKIMNGTGAELAAKRVMIYHP